MNTCLVQVRGERLQLLVERAVYWSRRRMLILSDLHLGKAAHFRSAGIAAPAGLEQRNLDRLDDLIKRTRPHEILMLGDLFHSSYNKVWEDFIAFRSNHGDVGFSLVTGNHDVLHPDLYQRAGIATIAFRNEGPFLFTHHPTSTTDLYGMAGHVHPAVRLSGKGRQAISLPCFWFGARGAVLPAFGGFTGTHLIRLGPGERAFAITSEQVIRVRINGE